MILLSHSISSVRPLPKLPASSALLRRDSASFSFIFSRDCLLPRFPSLILKKRANYSDIRASFTAKAQTADPNASGPVIVAGRRARSLRALAIVAIAACGVLVSTFRRDLAASLSVTGAGVGFLGSAKLGVKEAWPKVLRVLLVFKDQGLILAALLSLSAFFSMAETSITTLWPWKVSLHCFEEGNV
ncbi:putative DUF21 domain-containing protein [Platanthera guangdongensis]|uniref:DUF21 domain-containing protein n=1 Tax=Platanthera guangdongensis TaxID=2320717 RepID=A0ABR2N1N4_9ASPA